ncbi:MAG: hypothetical protein P1V97_37100, partial [Planctomycetota bacterium]|nr:hypothetical protein [Planctomycetota bacterium]
LLLIVLIVAFHSLDISTQNWRGKTKRFDTVVAKQFVLAGDDKKTHSTWAVSESGTASMTFYSKDGISRAALMVDKTGAPSLGFTGTKGKVQSLLTVGEKGPKWAFYDHGGEERMRMMVLGDEVMSYAGLDFCDKAGKTRFMVSVDREGRPMFNFFDEDQKHYGTYYVTERLGKPALVLIDQDKDIIWQSESDR